ncbi:MAG: hypothetical protein WD468_01490 [Pirellulales bacterium]
MLVVVIAIEMPSEAQTLAQPSAPGQLSRPGLLAQEPETNQAGQPSQAQLDKEWLTSYFLVHQGYKLHHMEAIDVTLNKMTPTQLHTLREMYDQKHSLMMQQQAQFNQWNAHQLAQAQAYNQKQQQQMSQISSEETQAANLSEQQINQMHQEAAANAENKSMSYPGMYGPYGGAYGGGYIHPYFNPLGGNPY